MDVLARRKTGGKITGDVLINGRKADSSLNRIIGYVEQQDIHNPTQTVLEALEFSAIVRKYFLFFLCISKLIPFPPFFWCSVVCRIRFRGRRSCSTRAAC
jgi:hypothetical protein